MTPMQMTNHKPSFAAVSPSPGKDKERAGKEFDIGQELVGFGLQGVRVTEDDLAELVKELGLEGEEAGELVRGLSGNTATPSTEESREAGKSEEDYNAKDEEKGEDTAAAANDKNEIVTPE